MADDPQLSQHLKNSKSSKMAKIKNKRKAKSQWECMIQQKKYRKNYCITWRVGIYVYVYAVV